MKIAKAIFRHEALGDRLFKNARMPEAASSHRSHCGEVGPAKAGTAAGGFFQQTLRRHR